MFYRDYHRSESNERRELGDARDLSEELDHGAKSCLGVYR